MASRMMSRPVKGSELELAVPVAGFVVETLQVWGLYAWQVALL